MTALCGGAASRAKPGFAPTVVLGQQSIGSILTLSKNPWAILFGYLLQAVTIDLNAMCNNDPPSLPVMSAGDMITLAAGPLGGAAYNTAVAKFYDFVRYWAWFQFCECVTIATPAPSAPQPAPVGLPDLAPPVGGLPSSGTCWDQSIVLHPALDTGVDITARLLPNLDSTARAIYPNPGYTMYVDMTDNRDGSAVGNWNGNIRFETAAGGLVSNFGLSQTSTNTVPQQVIGPVSFAERMKWTSSNWAAGDTDSVTIRVRLAGCPSNVGTPATPCCPPDPVLSGQMAQLLQLVTLIQRQVAPFGYVPGTAHAGLSGQGNIAVSGLIGCKVDITTLPTALGQSRTNPVEIFDAGFITWSTADGYPSSLRVDHNPYLSLPARCSAYTNIAYDLHPGVAATITELKREP
jgi:hypothetical protein